jgi:hypothetical protein
MAVVELQPREGGEARHRKSKPGGGCSCANGRVKCPAGCRQPARLTAALGRRRGPQRDDTHDLRGRHRFNAKFWKTRERKPDAEVVEIAVPPIIDAAAFEGVQALLKTRSPASPLSASQTSLDRAHRGSPRS